MAVEIQSGGELVVIPSSEARLSAFKASITELIGGFNRADLDLFEQTGLHQGHEFELVVREALNSRRWQLDQAVFEAKRFKEGQPLWD